MQYLLLQLGFYSVRMKKQRLYKCYKVYQGEIETQQTETQKDGRPFFQKNR